MVILFTIKLHARDASTPFKMKCGKDVRNLMMVMMVMMMMMKIMTINCFCGMVDRRKALSLISSQDHCQRSSASRISNTPRAGFEPAQNLSSGFVEWSFAVVITTKAVNHTTKTIHFKNVWSQRAWSFNNQIWNEGNAHSMYQNYLFYIQWKDLGAKK